MRAHRSRDWIGKIGIQIFERPADNAPEPARRKFALAGGFVDGNNASDFERDGCFFFCFADTALFVNVAENLELRLRDLQLAVAIFFHLAVERQHLPGLKTALQIRRIKPDALQPCAALADRELENRHAPRAKQPRIADLGNHCRHLSRAQLGNGTRVQPVFVAERQVVEQIVDGGKALGRQDFGQAWANAFHILHWSGRFQHLKRC